MKKKYKKIKEDIRTIPRSNAVREQLALEETYLHRDIEQHYGNIIVYIGDVKKALLMLPERAIDCIITSPPYWKQRDYKHSQQIGQESSYSEYIKRLVDVFNEAKRVLKPTGTFFLNVGYKYQDKELLLIPELLAIELQKDGWTLLNKIIWHKPNAMPSSLDNRFSNVYEPVFLFVKKESKYKYYLSLDELRLPVSNFTNNKKPEDILGLDVENSLFKGGDVKGFIKTVFRSNGGNILAQVDWKDGKQTIEFVNDFDKKSQIEIDLVCQDCGKTIKHEIDIDNHNQTLFCNGFLKPMLPPPPDFKNRVELKASLLLPFITSKQSYNGKYKVSPDNRGASPGARKSLFGEYLVLQRRYRIFQPVIADYLRFWRRKRNITTKEIDKLLGYRDTAGHWFRKDTGSWGRGGSIPLPDDWFKLKDILKFNDIYDRWVTETHLVLQTVKAHPKGKNPGDIWSIKTQPLPEAHFAIFPEELVRRCIESGCPPDGVVLDPFAGSGTTGKVAQELERNAILIELIPEYLNIIKKRCKDIKEIIHVK
ncbi:MAG: site-specific DNA-methyltransferase [Nitrospirota bacterium]